MVDKTIKQIADELGVSKQAIRQRINKLSSDCYYVGSNKTIYINEKGYKLLKEKASSTSTKNCTNVDTTLDTLLKQLEIKDKQIEELTKLLDQEQQLNAFNQKKIESLEDKHEGLFYKLFRRK